MSNLTKDEVERLLKIEQISTLWFGTFDLFLKGFGRSIEVSIQLCGNSRTLTDRTIEIVNEVANLTREHYEHILKLMFDDAMRAKEETSYNERQPTTETGPLSRLRQFLGLSSRYESVEMSDQNPKHPLFGIKTPADIERIIKWENICIEDEQETVNRFAFLTCYPPWEIEHGAEIAICNGEPVGIGQIELNPYNYEDP